MVPNAFRMLANGPAALQGYLGLRGALSHGTLDETMQRRIALAVSEINGSEYCVAGNTYLARMGKPDDAEITAYRNGASNDPYADAAVRFAAKIARARGHVSDDDVRAAKAAGYTDAQVVEITAVVAMSTLANYVNEVTGTDIDFPRIARQAKAALTPVS